MSRKLDVIPIITGSQEGLEFTMIGKDRSGALIDWTARTVTVQAIAFGAEVDPAAWEEVTSKYTDADGRHWGYIEGDMLAAARATPGGEFHVRCHIDGTDPPDKDVFVLTTS